VIRERILRGEVAVVGLGRSGQAVSQLLRRAGARVYASDAGASEPGMITQLAGIGVDAKAGGHDLDRIAASAVVVASPGVPPEAPPLARARAAGVPIVSEIEVALAFLTATKCIAVTGTNGKSTVTALVAHLLASLGLDAVAAGNIGTPLSEIALRVTPPAWVALELSSFQLHDTPSISPAVGVLTNLSPDHLDRYASLEEYYGDKMRLFANATDASIWVTNADDAEVERRMAGVRGTHRRFSMRDSRADAGPDVIDDSWQLLGSRLMATATTSPTCSPRRLPRPSRIPRVRNPVRARNSPKGSGPSTRCRIVSRSWRTSPASCGSTTRRQPT
jgi:UDP-N-acetylmuramoylalanine--D-glutamate ligase